NNCSYQSSVRINYFDPSDIHHPKDLILCRNYVKLELPFLENVSYSWNTGEQTSYIHASASGQYIYTATYRNCQFTDTIFLALRNVTEPSETISFCPGDSAFIHITGSDSVLWSDGFRDTIRYFYGAQQLNVEMFKDPCVVKKEVSAKLYPVRM